MSTTRELGSLVKIGLLAVLCVPNMAFASDVVVPSKITKEEVEGKIFQRPSMIKTNKGAHQTLDVVTMQSSDKKFDTGMYQAGYLYGIKNRGLVANAECIGEI